MNHVRITASYKTIGSALAEMETDSNARNETIRSFQVMTVDELEPMYQVELAPTHLVLDRVHYVIYVVDVKMEYMTANQADLLFENAEIRRREILGE